MRLQACADKRLFRNKSISNFDTSEELCCDERVGYDSEFTNKNATIMSWNLMHTATMLKAQGGFPVGGNVTDTWRDFTNAADQDPDRTF